MSATTTNLSLNENGIIDGTVRPREVTVFNHNLMCLVKADRYFKSVLCHLH